MESDSQDAFKNILTGSSSNRKNYQMFAYCPMVSHDNCGVNGNGGSNDMNLLANKEMSQVSSTSMKYREGKPSYREYDSCYYEITSEDLDTLGLVKTKEREPRVFVHFKKTT